jgi:phosphoribosylformimino-5-aminoimidazole carboxamide ribotide isomerase
MQVIPAIDLMKGKVVRLTKGDPDQATFYDNMGTPAEVGQRWKAQGAQRLHIIDLDAAFGKPDNIKVIEKIAKTSGLPVQVGGGIRSLESAERLLDAGIGYVILGSLALRDPKVIAKLQKRFSPERVIVALDNKDGMVMVEGWTSSTTFTVIAALEQYVKIGVKTFLITSVSRDGTLSGPDLETLNEACRLGGAEIIAAGGIGGLNDLVALSHTGVWGAVVGKAIYEGKFTLEQAINTVEQEKRTCH